ncbi:hypothetical protein B6N60_04154 [Richelia sinica FACHB-800]|uniref:Membrane fusion protein biotin-lipoyl like domain-containing protein n=1 Tax=Richelia sinica FACHB-800 TaxID=1357546 RepID=A0A975Y6N7_9NOST|nr:HlyD family efflux transporter periplasmic adaptor subunit [Richelia sinica]MBD2664878.1 HlyD family efflux transporter periplasmic adaptor subunit [Richelia sinica FACHB-800]QXE25439.1 hypothetical protein B6N60_04154 [Richelia sinica FACHB-800]
MLYTHNQKIFASAETDEVLPPISRWLSLTGILLVVTVISSIALSSWMKYNVTVKAAAMVRPTGEVRLTQSKIEGTVKNILVKENQTVKLGDTIAQLDTEALLLKRNQLQDNIQQSRLQIVQIDAQISALDSQILAEKRVIERTVAAAQADLLRNQRDYQEKQVNTQNDLLTSLASLEKSELDLEKAEADLAFAKVDSDRYRQLSQIGAIGKREFEQKKLIVKQLQSALKSEQKAVEIARIRVRTAKAAANPTSAVVTIATARIAQESARGEATIATLSKEKQALIERKVQLQSQVIQSKTELQQVDNQIKISTIVATSSGIILKLNLRNPGQVVRASESIAEIVPANAALVIKAMINTDEIHKVAVGQKVYLRIDACPYPDYGTLEGVVKWISPDVVNNSNNTADATSMAMNASYFEVTIEPRKLTFGNQEQKCRLQSGMEAKADIVTKEETALQFMLRKARLITDL